MLIKMNDLQHGECKETDQFITTDRSGILGFPSAAELWRMPRADYSWRKSIPDVAFPPIKAHEDQGKQGTAERFQGQHP